MPVQPRVSIRSNDETKVEIEPLAVVESGYRVILNNQVLGVELVVKGFESEQDFPRHTSTAGCDIVTMLAHDPIERVIGESWRHVPGGITVPPFPAVSSLLAIVPQLGQIRPMISRSTS